MTDLISRADVLEGLKHSTAYLHDDIYTIVNRIPSAETTGALDDAIAKYVADGYMLPPSGDYISRADAIEAFDRGRVYHKSGIEEILKALPSADTDMSEYADRLWKIAYERGKAEAEPKWTCTANFVAEQLERLRNMTDEERVDFLNRFFGTTEPKDRLIKFFADNLTDEDIAKGEEYAKGYADGLKDGIDTVSVQGEWIEKGGEE